MAGHRRRRSPGPRSWADSVGDRDRHAPRRRVLNVYLDTSAAVALVAREPPSHELRALLAAATSRYASLLTYVEAHAALAARRRAAPRHRRRFADARADFENLWQAVDVVDFDIVVARVAAVAAARHRLRGADAVHLASAASLAADIVVVTLDASLRRASLEAGLGVAPQSS
ncbi:MAG: PIN domain-containing protein [Gaiellaceae bacterium]